MRGEDDLGARTAAMRQASVRAAARRDRGFAVRRLRTSELSVPVGELRELHRTAPAAPVDRWSLQDRQGNEIAQVDATSYDHAVQVADKDPKVRAAAPGAGGLVYMCLDSIEKPARTVPGATPPPRTITVTFSHRKSIPTRLRESGAPGGTAFSKTAGALRWVLPGGEELTPGEAEKRFLN
ncbi:hypothetical protein ACPCVO_45280 [Streptomyces umbrinus]|uniref:hypothetical protein n=1 Tax=Streptomyces umbrinus TaxID=67370 RepID=UPI003C2C5634